MRPIAVFPIGRSERASFIGFAVVAWTYVVARAWLVPFVNDEARPFFLYNAVGSFQPGYAFPDAANHLLNTALGQVTYLLWGPSVWSLRLPNVLAFPVYAWYVYRSGGCVQRRVVRWCLWAGLLFLPFGIEFFSLFRGYGLSLTFWMMALFHLLRFVDTGRTVHVLGTLAGMLLAAYATLTLLVPWCIVLAQLAFFLVRPRVPLREQVRRWAAWVLLGVGPLLYLAIHAMHLSEQGAFYFGSARGPVNGTLVSLCLAVLGSDARGLVWFVAVAIVAAIVQGGIMGLRDPRGSMRMPLVILVQLLVLEMIGRLVLAHALGTLYPMDRTALYLVPLLLLVLAFGIDTAASRFPVLRWSALLFLALPLRLVRAADLDHTMSWPDEAISANIHTAAEDRQRRMDRPLVVGATSYLCPPWDLENMVHHPVLGPAQEVQAGADGPDMLLVRTQALVQFPAYGVTAWSTDRAMALCERRMPLRTVLVLDTLMGPDPAPNEFKALWMPERAADRGHALIVELEAVLSSEGPLETWLTCAERDTAGHDHAYVHLEFLRARTTWNADTLHAARWLPLVGGTGSLPSVTLWNKNERPYVLHRCRLRIHRVLDEDAEARTTRP